MGGFSGGPVSISSGGGGAHLCLGDDGLLPGVGAEEGGEGRGHHQGVGPHEAAQVAAGDGVLLRLQHQRVHGVEPAPGEPHRALLAQEGRPLEAQGERRAAVGDQVEPTEGGLWEVEEEGVRMRRRTVVVVLTAVPYAPPLRTLGVHTFRPGG